MILAITLFFIFTKTFEITLYTHLTSKIGLKSFITLSLVFHCRVENIYNFEKIIMDHFPKTEN